ncbi:MAG TPA: 2-phosphosulfolactate phosphatase [Actinomycetota bacterium]|nr:2-phosphosulfolactate phosphatase [Actinomycetota bacterium]
MTIEDQAGFDPRLAWASEGGTLLAPVCPVLVVVDVLRFTTAVEAAATNGAQVVPRRWPVREGSGGAGPALSSLSPVSLLGVPAGTRVELASPNGATVSLALAGAGAVVLAGCLRNASAVAAAARDLGRPVGVVPAGERRPDGSLRPAVEDLIGAGAILHALGGRPSPEARAAVAAFLDAAPDLPAALSTCVSGRELAARDLAADVRLAAAHDVSQTVPRLSGGAFAQLS